MILDWDNKVIELFADFADVDFQRRSWFGIGPEVSSPEEMCNWIGDIDLEGWIEINKGSIDPILAIFISDFLKKIDSLPQFMTDWRWFSSNEWISIRLEASVIRDLLIKRKHDIEASRTQDE